MPYCEVSPGMRLYYEDFGAGAPIVFICGGQVTHQCWEGQVASLADEFRTITFDWRGTGGSDKPASGYTPDRVVDDVVALMGKLGLPPAVLVGHGLGAHIALMTADRRPEAVQGLFLAAAAPWVSGERDGVAGGLPAEFLRFVVSQQDGSVPYAQICHQLGEDWLFHERQSPGVYFWVMQQSLAWPQHVMNQYAASIRSIDHAARLRRLRCPAVVVQGRFDRKQRFDGARYLAEELPNARFLVLENSAHMTFVEETRAFNQALREFARESAKAPVPA